MKMRAFGSSSGAQLTTLEAGYLCELGKALNQSHFRHGS